jgi:hypothetical protein
MFGVKQKTPVSTARQATEAWEDAVEEVAREHLGDFALDDHAARASRASPAALARLRTLKRPPTHAELRAALESVYELYAPERLRSKPLLAVRLLEQWKGRETELLHRVRTKYTDIVSLQKGGEGFNDSGPRDAHDADRALSSDTNVVTGTAQDIFGVEKYADL